MNVGATGKAYRLGKIECAAMATDKHEDFLTQMIDSYAFSVEQARGLDGSTQSWIAVPLVSSDGSIDGVLYCDSKERTFFTEDRQRVVAFAAVGIAFYVGLRYH